MKQKVHMEQTIFSRSNDNRSIFVRWFAGRLFLKASALVVN